ncbi:MAG: DNA recombination protein RmuC, partial [Arenibacter sp.]
MNELLVYAVLALVGLAIGYFLGNYIQNLKTKSSQSALLEREQQLRTNLGVLEQKLLDAEEYKAQLQSEKEQLGNKIVRYQAEMENLDLKNREQKGEVEKLQEKFTKEFENLANKILDEKSTKFTEQ